ncbi:MAG: DUF3783 domain-containing protein [Clostridia bacterium]|nr:DUF3783 domain-containing protein [Clostridia bacterium]
MSRPAILSFNLPDARLARLRFLCMKLGMLVRVVPPEDFSQPLTALCGLSERTEALPPETSFSEEMIVFCHMDNALVNRFIQTARQQRVPPFPLKAILTPTNAAWTPVQLCAELREEHAALQRGSTAHPEEN